MRNGALLLSICLLTGCGTMVAPMDGASIDAGDAGSIMVRFRLRTTTGTSFIAASNTKARIENVSRTIDVRTNGDGIAEVDLLPGSRWNVSFAREGSQVVSVVDFVVPSTPPVIDVFLPLLESSVPLFAESRPEARYPIGAVPIHVRGRLRNVTTAQMEWPWIDGYPYAISTSGITSRDGQFDLVVASFPNAPPLDVIAYERAEPGALSPTGYPPLRAVIRRLDPRPSSDTTLDLDMSTAVPCPAPATVLVTFPRDGLVTYPVIERFDRSTSWIRLDHPFGAYGEFQATAGESFGTPDDAASSMRVRNTLISALLPMSDALGSLMNAAHTLNAQPANGDRLQIVLNARPVAAEQVSVPAVGALRGEGQSLGDFSYRTHGEYAQSGVVIASFGASRNDQLVLWTVWGYGPPNQSRTEPYRLPRLPEGVSIANLAPRATTFTATTFVSTLPASQPGYGFWRPAAESVRVAHQLELSSAGR